MLADASHSIDGWNDFLNDVVYDKKLLARLKAKSLR